MNLLAAGNVKNGRIRRLVSGRDSQGHRSSESWIDVVAPHQVDVQNTPFESKVEVNYEQLKFPQTLRIFPANYNATNVQHGDYYFLDSQLLKIFRIWDFDGLCYYDVLIDGNGVVNPNIGFDNVVFPNVGETGSGDLIFGEGDFAAAPVFDNIPDVYHLITNPSGYYFEDILTSGLSLRDKYTGAYVNTTVYLFPDGIDLGTSLFYKVLSVAPGVYNFGVAPFDSVPPQSTTPGIFTLPRTDGTHYIRPITNDSFAVEDRYVGSATPLVDVLVVDNSSPDKHYLAFGLGEGEYIYGEGSLTSFPEFAKEPILMAESTADADFYIPRESISERGFEIKSTGFGSGVSVSILAISRD